MVSECHYYTMFGIITDDIFISGTTEMTVCISEYSFSKITITALNKNCIFCTELHPTDLLTSYIDLRKIMHKKDILKNGCSILQKSHLSALIPFK